MKNWEKHFDGLLDVFARRYGINKRTGTLNSCSTMICEHCLFDGDCGYDQKRIWLLAEAEEEIPMTEDERNVLQALYNMGFRFIARDTINVRLTAFSDEPKNYACDGEYDWVIAARATSRAASMDCFSGMFKFIKPEKPEEIKHLLDCAVIRENRTVAENATVAEKATCAKNAPIERGEEE